MKVFITFLFIIIPIFQSFAAEVKEGCIIGGCSGQICADNYGENQRPIASTCEWTERYGCYKKVGVCEKQDDGKCGWTQSKELQDCIEKANDNNGLKVIKIQ